jgi:hypothetical protein
VEFHSWDARLTDDKPAPVKVKREWRSDAMEHTLPGSFESNSR